jgi:hypothetical protein
MVSPVILAPTVSQLFQSLLPESSLPTIAPTATTLPPPTVSQAVKTLCQLLDTLCALNSGWPSHTPKTPATLLPYVLDEVMDVLETLHHLGQEWEVKVPPPFLEEVSAPTLGAPPAAITPVLLSAWSTQLLWAIAASTPDAMLLLEGCAIELPQQPDIDAVRLVPKLHVQGLDYACDLDLVTRAALTSDTLLEDPWQMTLTDDPTSLQTVGEWRDFLWAALIVLMPDLASWRCGKTVWLLIPGGNWAAVQVQLDLYLSGVSSHSLLPIVEDGEAFLLKTEASLQHLGMPSSRVWVAQPAVRSLQK